MKPAGPCNLLMLVHRIPYPPDKGDKIRSYHLLRHLAARRRVHLGAFVDDTADLAHEPALRAICPDLRLFPIVAHREGLAGQQDQQARELALARVGAVAGIADDAESFAAATLGSMGLGDRTAARQLVVERFSWGSHLRVVDELIGSAIASDPGRPA